MPAPKQGKGVYLWWNWDTDAGNQTHWWVLRRIITLSETERNPARGTVPHQDIRDRFWLRTFNTIPLGWQMKLCPDIFFNWILDGCLLKTRSTIPFGWLIKLGRRCFAEQSSCWCSFFISIFDIDSFKNLTKTFNVLCRGTILCSSWTKVGVVSRNVVSLKIQPKSSNLAGESSYPVYLLN